MAITFIQNCEAEFNRAASISSKKIRLDTTTATCSAITLEVPDVWDTITKFVEQTKGNDYFNAKRSNKMNIGC
jgi:LAO/AO transport system kinase